MSYFMNAARTFLDREPGRAADRCASPFSHVLRPHSRRRRMCASVRRDPHQKSDGQAHLYLERQGLFLPGERICAEQAQEKLGKRHLAFCIVYT